jgi:transposase
MAYSVDLRSRVIGYLEEGNRKEDVSVIFKVSASTIRRWLALYSETGSLEKQELNRTARIYKSEELNRYIEENPSALLKDIAEKFGGSTTGAFYALEREKITYKKKSHITKSATL